MLSASSRCSTSSLLALSRCQITSRLTLSVRGSGSGVAAAHCFASLTACNPSRPSHSTAHSCRATSSASLTTSTSTQAHRSASMSSPSLLGGRCMRSMRIPAPSLHLGMRRFLSGKAWEDGHGAAGESEGRRTGEQGGRSEAPTRREAGEYGYAGRREEGARYDERYEMGSSQGTRSRDEKGPYQGIRQRHPWEKGAALIKLKGRKRTSSTRSLAPSIGLIRARAAYQPPAQLEEGDDGSILAALEAYKKARAQRKRVDDDAQASEEQRKEAKEEASRRWDEYRVRASDAEKVRESEARGDRKEGWEDWEREAIEEKRLEEIRLREQYVDGPTGSLEQRYPGDKGNALVNGKSLVELNRERHEAYKKLAGNPPKDKGPRPVLTQTVRGKQRVVVSRRRRKQMEYWAGGDL